MERWDGTWNLTLATALSNQRANEFMIMQQALLRSHNVGFAMDRNGLELNSHLEGRTRGSMRGYVRRVDRSSKHGEVFWIASSLKKTYDTSSL